MNSDSQQESKMMWGCAPIPNTVTGSALSQAGHRSKLQSSERQEQLTQAGGKRMLREIQDAVAVFM